MKNTSGPCSALLAWGALAGSVAACTGGPIVGDGDGSDTGSTSMDGTTTAVPTVTLDDTSADETGTPRTDLPDVGPDPDDCAWQENCPLDLLIVVDNSGTMGDEQLAIANNVEELVDELFDIRDVNGERVRMDVNIMVTTTDMGHPLCEAFYKPDYAPAEGAPIYSGCNARINRFTGADPMDPVIIEEACTDNCPVDIAPADHFINASRFGTNVPGDDVESALACILPQGIDGCGYESPLESMLQALDPSQCWNDPSQPGCDDDPEWADVERGFLRPDGVLGVMLFTDELDCSVAAPEGYSFFTDVENTIYWNVNPQQGQPRTSSAICFNAGVTCEDVEGDGVFEGCASMDTGVLHPVERYGDFFQSLVEGGKSVVMMGGVGIPSVIDYSPEPPFEPIAGGLVDLQYRTWIDGPYPAGDIDPWDWMNGENSDYRIFEYGDLGPGCTRTDAFGELAGQALPPVRVREVCEGLNTIDEDGAPAVRCCLESVCGDDFSRAIRCLSGVVPLAPTSK